MASARPQYRRTMPVVVSRFLAPEAERENWGANWCLAAFRECGITLGEAEQAYPARATGRDAYKRARERSHEGVEG